MKKTVCQLVFFHLCLFGLFSALGASAQTLAYTTSWVSETETELYQVDLETGKRQSLGTLDMPFLAALAFHPDGLLYGLALDLGSLWLIDETNVEILSTIPLNLDDADENEVTAMTFDTCGQLWITNGPRLHLVDLSSGTSLDVREMAQPLDSLAASEAGIFGSHLTSDLNHHFVRLDLATGTQTPIQLDTYEINQIAFDADGTLWGVGWYGGVILPIPGGIFRINWVTRATQRIPSVSFDIAGPYALAIAPPSGGCNSPQIPEIPTLSDWGIGVLIFALLLASFFSFRRADQLGGGRTRS